MRARLLRRLALGAALLTGCGEPSGMASYPLVRRLLVVMDEGRAYQLRLSPDQTYHPCVPPETAPLAGLVCQPTTAVTMVSEALADLAPLVLDAMRQRPDADALWAAALLDLWSGRQDARLLDRAITRLTEVRARDTSSAAVLNHLAAAHAARASVRDDPRDLYAAVDFIERASAIDRHDLDVDFNRAVLLTLIRTDRQVGEVLKVLNEAASEWRDEAIAFAASARRPIARLPAGAGTDDEPVLAPQTAREYLFDTVLVSWATARLSGDTAAAESLASAAGRLASALVRSSGDSSMLHVVDDLSVPGQVDVATGVRAMSAGMRLYARPAYVAAGDSLRKSSRLLRSSGAYALADWSDNQVAAVHMAAGDLSGAAARFTRVVENAQRRGDKALEARSRWGRAIASGRGSSMTAAEQDLIVAESLFRSIGEVSNAGTIRITLGEAYAFLGRNEEAARSLFEGFSSKPALRYEDLLSLAQWMTEAHPWALALVIREVTRIAETSVREKDLPESLLRLAQAQVAVGHDSAAVSSLARARRESVRVMDPLTRARLDAELDRADADLYGAVEPRRSLARIDSARRYFHSIPLEDAGLLLRRSRLSLAVAESAQASRDLGEALDIVRNMGVARGGVTDRPVASTLREAHRHLVALTLARGDTAGAFAHARALGALSHVPDGFPPVQRGLPAGELRYVVLEDRILTWFSANGRTRVAVTHMAEEDLGSLIARFGNLLRSGDDTVAADSLSRRLFDLLLAPHQEALDAQTHLDIAADGILNEIPFAFLTGRRGRLIERVAIRYVVVPDGPPADSRPVGKTARKGPLLVVNPDWSRSIFPGLEPLRWAEVETRSIAEMQPRHTVVSGSAATRTRIIEALREHDVMHFAGHARVVVENPPRSHLVLAQSGPGFSDGVLFAADIARLALDRVRLVVLSACGRSGSGANSAGEINGLATAFLNAGAETVLSGLWEIDDEVTSRLMTSVHSNLARGLDVAEALRQAQVALLKEPEANGHWFSVAAAFVVHTRGLN